MTNVFIVERGSKRFFTCSGRFFISSGFSSNAVAPTAETTAAPRRYNDNNKIGVIGILRLRIMDASMPFILGILTSRITTSGCNWLAFSTASTPSQASAHTLNPAFSSTFRAARRTTSLSSAIRIVFVLADPDLWLGRDTLSMFPQSICTECPTQYSTQLSWPELSHLEVG